MEAPSTIGMAPANLTRRALSSGKPRIPMPPSTSNWRPSFEPWKPKNPSRRWTRKRACCGGGNGWDRATSLKAQVSEDKTWLTESRLISLAALNSALDGRFRGFVAGLGASIAVGAAAFALAGGVEEPPAMSSLEAQDGPPVIAEEAESEASEMGANTHLPLRTTLPGDIAAAQPESSEIGASDEDVKATIT